MFASCLDFAIKRSVYNNVNVKPKQALCLEAIYRGKDTVAVLPTGYGKSLVYQLLPHLLAKRNAQRTAAATFTLQSVDVDCEASTLPVVLVISPLNSLIEDQARKINANIYLRAGVLQVGENISIDVINGDCDIVFLHPEACLSSKRGLEILQSERYTGRVGAIVVDEAHCILEW